MGYNYDIAALPLGLFSNTRALKKLVATASYITSLPVGLFDNTTALEDM